MFEHCVSIDSSNFGSHVVKRFDMEFKRNLFPGHTATGVTKCQHTMPDEKYCKECTTCALCDRALGNAQVGTACLDDGKTSVYYHIACLDCPERERRSVWITWTNKEKGECVLTLKHIAGCRCTNWQCTKCHNAFSYGAGYNWVRLGEAKCCGNKFEHYHYECLPQEKCSVCDKGLAFSNHVLVSTGETLRHRDCK